VGGRTGKDHVRLTQIEDPHTIRHERLEGGVKRGPRKKRARRGTERKLTKRKTKGNSSGKTISIVGRDFHTRGRLHARGFWKGFTSGSSPAPRRGGAAT